MRRMVKGSVEEGVEFGRVGGTTIRGTVCILNENEWCESRFDSATNRSHLYDVTCNLSRHCVIKNTGVQ